MTYFIDSLRTANEVSSLAFPQNASGRFVTYQNKKYQYLGKFQVAHGACWWVKRVLAIAALAIAALCTLGAIFLLPQYRSLCQHIRHELKNRNEKMDCYVLHNLQNWCLMKHSPSGVPVKPGFSIKKFWDNDIHTQWWSQKCSAKELQRIHDTLIQGRNIPPLFGRSPIVDYDPFLPGIAVLAHYLSSKTGQNELYVCQNLRAFQEELIRIKNQDQDQRKVLIIPTYAFATNPSKSANCEQHKLAVGIEKVSGKMRIYVLEGSNSKINPSKVHLRGGAFSEMELVFSYMKAAKLPTDTTYFMPDVHRQRAEEGGCSTFALRDAIAFLEDEDFFQKLDPKQGKGTILDPFMSNLPPNFMKTTQSMKLLKDFLSKNVKMSKELLGRARRNLRESIQRHTVKVGDKEQNRLISRRLMKYRLLLIFFLNHFTDRQINAMIHNKMIRSSAKSLPE